MIFHHALHSLSNQQFRPAVQRRSCFIHNQNWRILVDCSCYCKPALGKQQRRFHCYIYNKPSRLGICESHLSLVNQCLLPSQLIHIPCHNILSGSFPPSLNHINPFYISLSLSSSYWLLNMCAFPPCYSEEQ